MPERMTDARRSAVECGLEAGKPVALIAAENEVSIATVYKVRLELQALREKHGLEPLPKGRTGITAAPLTEREQAIRAEYLQTGAIRPLARKNGMTVEKLRHLIERAPSVVEQRAKRMQPEDQQ
jgi:transposase